MTPRAARAGTGAGNQTSPAVTAPLEATGNQVTVIGDGNTSDTDQTGGSSPAGSGSETDGQDGTGSGNQTSPAATLPVDTSDNQFTVIGDGNTNTGSDGDGTGTGTTPEQAGTETGQPETDQPEQGGTQGETQGGSGLAAGPTSAARTARAATPPPVGRAPWPACWSPARR